MQAERLTRIHPLAFDCKSRVFKQFLLVVPNYGAGFGTVQV